MHYGWKEVLNFVSGCFRAPVFFVSTFFLYVKWLKLASDLEITTQIKLLELVSMFFLFINKVYKYSLILPIEYVFRAISSVTSTLGLDFIFEFPTNYFMIAYISTILYGAQRASSTLYGPVTTYGMSDVEKAEWDKVRSSVSDIQDAILNFFWSAILIVYIPINRISIKIAQSLEKYEFLSAKRTSSIFKVFLGGFFMLGILFVLYDIFLVLFLRAESHGIIINQKRFLLALFVALTISILATLMTIFTVGFHL